MNEEMRRRLNEYIGQEVEVQTKNNGKIKGYLCWISPDRCMAEIKLQTGEINTVMDNQIKCIRKL